MFKKPPIVTAYESLIAKSRLQPNSAQLALVNELGQLQQTLLNPKQSSWKTTPEQHRHGIYIYGGVGTGKSHIADLFAYTLPESVRCRRVHFHKFMVDVHLRLHHARSQTNYSGDPLLGIGREVCYESPVLCFDEFQVSDIADAMILQRLFGSFWDSGGLMVSTSNRHPTELYLNGLNRPLFVPFIRELQKRCVVWKVSGDHDYRMNGEASKRSPVFFTDPSTFDNMLHETTNGQHFRDLDLKVAMNRSIKVRSTENNTNDAATTNSNANNVVVQSNFKQLCQTNLGPSDYHALCNHARTIFLSGLRTFAMNELDFVRRFITLIDIAYESRTRLVCLSTTPLSMLFENLGVTTEAQPKSEISDAEARSVDLTVKGKGGSSSSMMSTFINDVEWSATGLTKASLATGGAGEIDVRFAIGRALSRLSEMESTEYGRLDD